ncbi:histidine kinase [Trinickia symbiotica]|uniref:histidine kinase n=1 Tax=Trinickia symbiotica TaxID=863227 RepID=A0A2T3XS34_9BURK|nr:sensor histidine kinase [Trinickia symbiotica]PTB19304.1 histidine kinase [Trinickia symbiotica]
MKLFTKGLLLIAVPSVVELALLGMLSKTQEQATQAAQWAAHSKQVLYQASVVVDPLLRAASRARAGLIAGDPSFFDQRTVWAELDDKLDQLEKFVADDPLQVARLSRMHEAVHAYRARVDAQYASLKSGRRAQFAAFDDTPLPTPIVTFRDELDAFVAAESRLDEERSAELAATRAGQRRALIAAIAGSMLIWALAALGFAGNIGRRLAALTANAERLGRGRSLGAPLAGDDEIAALDKVLHRTSARLAQAEHEQATLQTSLEARARELTEANENLRQQKQDNDMFIYSVSHDLRSPLVNLQGFSRELQVSCEELRALLDGARLPEAERERIMHVLDGNLSEALHFLRTAVARSAAIIDALLRISRAGRLEYQWQRVSVARTVARVIEALHGAIAERGISVSVGELPPAWGDPTAIEQIFGNLIGNAINYLDPARPGRIEVGAVERPADDTAARGPRMRAYYVKDNGLGIPDAYMPKMFSAFQRLHGDRSKGDGIGLALVRRVTERHGGRAWVESVEGVGSTFFVTLPEQPIRM